MFNSDLIPGYYDLDRHRGTRRMHRLPPSQLQKLGRDGVHETIGNLRVGAQRADRSTVRSSPQGGFKTRSEGVRLSCGQIELSFD